MRTRISPGRGAALLGVSLGVALTLGGCSGSGTDAQLQVVSFNLDQINGVFLNERLIIEFSAPVDPESVNNQTLKICYGDSNPRIDTDGDCYADFPEVEPGSFCAIPEGEFTVEGNRVIFQPRIPSSPQNNDVGLFPSHMIDLDGPDPDCNRDTPVSMTYTVTIPGVSAEHPVTIVSLNDKKPMVKTFNSFFTMIFDEVFPPEISLASFLDLVPGAPVFEGLLSPEDGAADVPLEAAVSVKFSEAFVPSTVTPDSIYLAAVGPNTGREGVIPAEITLDQFNGIVNINPLINLPGDSEIVLRFNEGLKDFGGHSVDIPQDFVFPSFHTVSVPESGPVVIREDFDSSDTEDPAETSALWNDPTQPGYLAAGQGGGTAFLGVLDLDPEVVESVVFDTGSYDPDHPLPSFDYSTVHIGPKLVLRAVGENPLIIKATSDILIEGNIGLAGQDAPDVIDGAVLGTLGGQAVAGGGSGGDGGTAEGEDGGAGIGPRKQGTANERHPGGGGGSAALVCSSGGETGGGGGGEHAGNAAPGKNDDGGGTGGTVGLPYGAENLDPFAGNLLGGSGGGGAGTTCIGGQIYPGGGGGGGGGALWLQAAGKVEILGGDVAADGGDGADNDFFSGSQGGAAGGGGSGGGILLQGITEVRNDNASTIGANGGLQGIAGESGQNDGSGGRGGIGRIRVEGSTLDLKTIRFSPNPSTGSYMVDGQTSVGTTTWIDTGAFFANFSFARMPGQDNSGQFPDPEAVIRYYFQGAPPDPSDSSQPDLDNVRPATGVFTTDIDEVDDSQFIRVKIVFTYPYPHNGILPKTDFFEISYTFSGGTSRLP